MQCRLKVSLQYKSIGEDPTYGAGVGDKEDAGSVPNTYFPMRRGCNVHLYSDAHQVLCLSMLWKRPNAVEYVCIHISLPDLSLVSV